MAVVKGYLAKVYASSPTSTTFTNETMTEVEPYIYQIDNILMQVWDPSVGIAVSEGTLDHSWMDRGVDWFTGRVKLNETGLTLTVSGGYFSTLIEVGEAYNWSLDIAADIVDISTFGDEWKKKTALQNTWTGSFEKFMLDDYWFDALSKFFIVKFYTDTNKGYQGFCVIPSLSTSASITDVVKETVGLEGHWKIIKFNEA